MSKITLLSFGHGIPSEINQLEHNFTKRFQQLNLHCIHLKPKADPIKQESFQLEQIEKLKKKGPVKTVALDERGKLYTSTEFTDHFFSSNTDLIFIIGPDEGMSRQFINSCDETISLSKMTLPHRFARLILIEQLYRAQCIQSGHPYHKA